MEPPPGTLLTSLEETPSTNNGGKERKAMQSPMVPMTSSMWDSGLVLRKALLEVPLVGRAYRICCHCPHPIVQERTFKAVGTGPSDWEFMWQSDNEGNRILGSSAVFLASTGQATAIIQTTALHQEANHRKKKPEQAEKIEVPPKHALMFFSEERLLFHVLKTDPTSRPFGFLSHNT